MSNPEAGHQRIAFVLGTDSGGELAAGNRDVTRVYSLLTDPQLGMCKILGPKPFVGCKSKQEFTDWLYPLLVNWKSKDQFVFYFTGHGEIVRGQYCLRLGHSDIDIYPFDNLMNDFQVWGVTRAILILDTCYSGAAVGIKGDEGAFLPLQEEKISKGIAIIASSRAIETSQELPDGSSSVFTHLLCQAIETGLNGKHTLDGNIAVNDVVTYIADKLESDEKLSGFHQRPVYSVNASEGNIWIAKNKSGKPPSQQAIVSGVSTIKSSEELLSLYHVTVPTLHPCLNAAIDDLEWNLVEKFAKRVFPEFISNEKNEFLKKLKLFSPITHDGSNLLHKSAILCFASHPELFYPQAKSIFVVGNPSDPEFVREDVAGPLSVQVQKLIDLTRRYLSKISNIDYDGNRVERSEINIDIIRELISNAITHRDYEANGLVKVTVKPDAIEIQNPGKFPGNLTWGDFLEINQPVSTPTNAAIALYLSNLLVFEGIGRGFDIIRKHIKRNGADSIQFSAVLNATVSVRVSRYEQLAKDNQTNYERGETSNLVIQLKKERKRLSEEKIQEYCAILKQLGTYFQRTLPSEIDLVTILETEKLLNDLYNHTQKQIVSNDFIHALKQTISLVSYMSFDLKEHSFSDKLFMRAKDLGESLHKLSYTLTNVA